MLDERTRFWLLVACGLLAAALVGWGTWTAIGWVDRTSLPQTARKEKVFKRTLIEDLRVTRHGVRGIEFVRCGTCRLEKRKRGVLTFGGMNVLVLEDLEVVIPPSESREGEPEQSEKPKDGGDSLAVVRRMGVSDNFLSARGIPFKFSGVRISGLKVSRLEGSNTVVRVFSAKSAEAKSDGLALDGCKIVRPDGEERVRSAKLKLAGRALRLEWEDGRLDIL